MRDGAAPGQFWEVLRRGKIIITSVGPPFLRNLMEYYNDTISCLPSQDRERYIMGLEAYEQFSQAVHL